MRSYCRDLLYNSYLIQQCRQNCQGYGTLQYRGGKGTYITNLYYPRNVSSNRDRTSELLLEVASSTTCIAMSVTVWRHHIHYNIMIA